MKTNLSRLSVASLSFFCMEIIDYSNRKAAKLVENHPLLKALQSEYELFYPLIDKQTYSGKGKEVALANANRLDVYLAVRLVLRGFAKAKGYSGQTDARELLSLFTLKGKNVFQDSYGSKSTDLNHLVRELAKPAQVVRIEKLGLTELIDLLVKAYNEFERKYDEQLSANAVLHGQPSATSLRRNVEKSLQNYLNYIKAMSSVEDDWKLFYLYAQEIAKKVSMGGKGAKKAEV